MSAPAPLAPLVVLSGPSGAGKTTVSQRMSARESELWVSISVTTRKPRPGEVDGVHYRFITDDEFDRMVAADDFLEWAPSPSGASGRYGTPREPVVAKRTAGVPVLLEIDMKGARQVRQSSPDALFVFLAPPSWEELVRRLTGRGTESPEAIERRLEVAREELAAEREFDTTLINTDVDAVCNELLTLVRSTPTHPEAL